MTVSTAALDRNVIKPQTTVRPSYEPSLDGLRAIAAVLVIVEHVYQNVPFIKAIIPGYFGVRFFFVLSGFLITRILLGGANQVNTWREKRQFWKNFYLRRSLRIFPAYYLCLVITAIASIWANGLQGHYAWRFAYLTNFHMALNNTGDTYYGHLWTLAVEEQFYLIWPFVVLLLPPRLRKGAVLILIAVAPLARFWAAQSAPNEFWIRKPTWSCLDSLGFGALLACLLAPTSPQLRSCSTGYRITVIGCIVLTIVGLFARWSHGERAGEATILLGLSEGFVFFALIRACLDQGIGFWRKILIHKWLVAVGKVSYGLYLYHAFTMPLVSFVFRMMHWEQRKGLGLHIYFLFVVALSITIAFASWHLFEAPINRLKSRFPYFQGSNLCSDDVSVFLTCKKEALARRGS